MEDKRPINVNPLSIKLPIMALVSISHRLSGLIVFALIPLLIYIFDLSLQSKASWDQLTQVMTSNVVKFSVWVVVSALIFHLIAGIRHLFMDIEIGESLKGARFGAVLVFLVSAILIMLSACWIWG